MLFYSQPEAVFEMNETRFIKVNWKSWGVSLFKLMIQRRRLFCTGRLHVDITGFLKKNAAINYFLIDCGVLLVAPTGLIFDFL